MGDINELKELATKLGITFSPNIGYNTLKSRIDEKLKESAETNKNTGDVATDRKEMMKLVRCVITCKNPTKLAWKGEIISVGNSKVGFVKKFVLFNKPYHIPTIILNVLREREFLQFSTRMVNGEEKVTSVPMKEFDIQILEPITAKELEEIKMRQSMSQISDDVI